MKKICVITVVLTFALISCSQEAQNKISRKKVEWLEGDYLVTFVEGSTEKVWEIHSGKITSSPTKGYYFFWARINGEKRYVQTPVARTVIEETDFK